MDNKRRISDLIYENLDYMYCDNCRYFIEMDDDLPCEDCHRKYNGWAVSRAEADRISELILKKRRC